MLDARLTVVVGVVVIRKEEGEEEALARWVYQNHELDVFSFDKETLNLVFIFTSEVCES